MVLPFPNTVSATPGALRLAAAPAIAALPVAIVSPPVATLLLGLAGAIVWFHRDPEREPPATGIVSPADGRVSVVRDEGGRLRVGVFMNVTDVHVTRAPAPGVVADVTHRPGANRPAFSKDSDRNERVRIDCDDYELALIAGWFARRVHPYVEPGNELDRGQRVGHVSFGSRADVVLPPEFDRDDLRVAEGDVVRAGETVIALDGS